MFCFFSLSRRAYESKFIFYGGLLLKTLLIVLFAQIFSQQTFAQTKTLSGTFFYQATQVCKKGSGLFTSTSADQTKLFLESEGSNTITWTSGFVGTVNFGNSAAGSSSGTGLSRINQMLFNPSNLTFPPPEGWSGKPATTKRSAVAAQTMISSTKWTWSYDAKSSQFYISIYTAKDELKSPFEVGGDFTEKYILTMISPTSFIMTEAAPEIRLKKGKYGSISEFCFSQYLGGKLI